MGAQEVRFPALLPREPYEQTNRWTEYGPNLFRLQDRKRADLLLGPTSPSTAFRLGEKAADPVEMYLSDIYTIAVNLAGLPGMSLPCGFASGLPVGLQLIGNYFAEAQLLNAAHRYQQATDWHRQHPEGLD